MSRNFTSTTPDFLRINSAALQNPPLSVSAWGRVDDAVNAHAAFFLGRSGTGGDYWALLFHETQTIRWRIVSNLASLNVNTVATFTSGQWHHIMGITAAVDDHRVFLDGGNKVTSGTTRDPTGTMDRTSIGRQDDNSPSNNFDGDLAHIALWDVALTDDEVASLAAGASPLQIRRDSLIAYWPVGGQSPEQDVVGAFDMTVNGTPTQSDEPPIPHSVVAGG